MYFENFPRFCFSKIQSRPGERFRFGLIFGLSFGTHLRSNYGASSVLQDKHAVFGITPMPTSESIVKCITSDFVNFWWKNIL